MNLEMKNYFLTLEEDFKKINVSPLQLKALFCICNQLWTSQLELGLCVLGFDDGFDTFISHPFYDSTGRELVNPIEEYGNDFIESDCITKVVPKLQIDSNSSNEEINDVVAKVFSEYQELIYKENIEDLENIICFQYDGENIINPFVLNGEDINPREYYGDTYINSDFASLMNYYIMD